MRKTLVAVWLSLFLLLPSSGAQEVTAGKVAFIKDNELYTANAEGSGVLRLTEDGVEKYDPKWSADGNRLAYQRKVDQTRAVADIQVISADGKPVREILFRPPGSGMGMRGVGRLWWSSGSRLVLFGDASPYSCEYVAISVDTGQTTADFDGFCPSFVESPDKFHMACASGPGAGSGPEENWRQGLVIDGRTIFPPTGLVPTGRFISGLQWSADSTSVAVLEEDSATKLKSVTVATTKGLVTRVPVPRSFELPMVLEWAENTLTLKAEGTRYSIDVSAKVLRLAAPEIEEHLSAQAETRRSVSDVRKKAIELARKLGAKSDEDIDVLVPETQP